MSEETERMSLATINRGQTMEEVTAAFQAVAENIIDTSTSDSATRTITVKIKMKPTNDRQRTTLTAEVTMALAPVRPKQTTTAILLGRDGVSMVELRAEQPDMFTERKVSADKPAT